MSKPFVAGPTGPGPDLPVIEKTFRVSKAHDMAHEARITSACRTPDATHAFLKGAEGRGRQMFLAASRDAGMRKSQ